MSAQHYAEAEVLADGYASVRFVCTGTDEDGCHQWCAEGCEESCQARAIILWPASLGAKTPVDGEPHRWQPHPRIGESTCREMEWLDAVDWQDSGWVDEPDKGGEREVTTEDLRPGRHLIETEWTGDDYIWRYPEEEATAIDMDRWRAGAAEAQENPALRMGP